jgi:hypothetical protein
MNENQATFLEGNDHVCSQGASELLLHRAKIQDTTFLGSVTLSLGFSPVTPPGPPHIQPLEAIWI